MIWLLLRSLVSTFETRGSLALENLALRQQLAVQKRSVKRPRFSYLDRGLWVLLRRFWTDWAKALVIVKPDTVVRWHRAGFRRYWTWRSRRLRPGRPCVAPEIRELNRNMCRANPLWGAPRVHGELAKLGISISQAAVSKYMIRCRKPPSQTWRSFLDNHVEDLVSIDFFTLPRIGNFKPLDWSRGANRRLWRVCLAWVGSVEVSRGRRRSWSPRKEPQIE